MPSKCGFEGCDKKGSLQGKLPAVDKCLYFCSAGHMQAAGAVQTEKNRKQRQDCNAKILLTRKRKREDGAGMPASPFFATPETAAMTNLDLACVRVLLCVCVRLLVRASFTTTRHP